MSIINDALKKVEISLGSDYAEATVKKTHPLAEQKANKYLIYVLIFVFGLFLENTFFLYFFHPQVDVPRALLPLAQANNIQLSAEKLLSEPKEKLPVQSPPAIEITALDAPSSLSAAAAVKEEPPEDTALVLNGIFFSQKDGYYALINNKIVKEGDDIEGSIVKRIELNDVELESPAGKLVKLSKGR